MIIALATFWSNRLLTIIFLTMVKIMVEADLKENVGELYLIDGGFKTKNRYEYIWKTILFPE